MSLQANSQPRLAPLAPIRGAEPTNSAVKSVLDEIPQPAPRRRLRPPEEILNPEPTLVEISEDEGANRNEEEIEEIDARPTTKPYRAAESARQRGSRGSLPLDIASAFQIEERETVKSPTEQSTSSSTRSPTEKKPGSAWIEGIASPPIRSPTAKPLWEIPSDPQPDRPPRRRLSQWLAEDPDIKMVAEAEERRRADQRHKLEREGTVVTEEESDGAEGRTDQLLQSQQSSSSDVGTLVRRESSQEIQPVDPQQLPNSEPQAPRPRMTRRESIKVHLQRIKQKAEKVLEEVHDRFVEGTSGEHASTVTPATTTANNVVEEEPTSHSLDALTSPLSPQSEPTMAELATDGQRVLSPTPSQSSRRTISSAEIKDKMRTKIRKQAEKVVERTRGSVQLTKRLQRRATFRDTEEALSVEEISQTDQHIHSAIQLGSKFMRKEESRVYSDEKQMAFIIGDPTAKQDRANEPARHVTCQYVGALPEKEYPDHLFAAIESRSRDDLEANTRESKKTADGMDLDKMAKRVSSRLLEPDGRLKRLDQLEMMAPFSLPIEIPLLEDPPVHYMPAIHWREANKRFTRHFVQLDVEVGQLVFEFHWLANQEDMLAMKIRSLIEVQLEKARMVSEGIKEIQERHSLNPDATPETRDEVDVIVETTEAFHKQFESVTTEIKRLVSQLNEVRHRQGYSTNPLHVRRAPIPRRVDGEPFAFSEFFLLTEDHPTTKPTDQSLPNEERIRMNVIQKCEVQISIFFNEILVYRTPPRALTPSFTVNFAEIYNLEIYSPPETITMKICERFARGEYRELCSLGIPLPDDSVDVEGNFQTRLHFASDLKFDKYSNSLGADCEDARVQGVILCGSKWAQTPTRLTQSSVPVQSIRKKSLKEESFHLFPPCTQLISEEEFSSDLRLEILSMRYERRLWDLPQYRRIPLDSSEIDSSLLLGEGRRDPRRSSRGVLDAHREKSLRYAALIRSELLERFKRSDESKSYSDLVREEPLPTFFGAFSSLFGPVDQSRRLKPMRQTIQRAQISSSFSLVVNVQSAVELPLRNESQSLESFVQISFQGETKKTNVAGGRNPTWQHTITLPVRRESDETELKTIMDYIEVSIYDQLVSPLPLDDRLENTVHEQLMRRFIASVRIPFSTVLCRGNIEGQLRLQLPLYLLGYGMSEKPCYIRLLIALSPSITPPRLIPPQLNGSLETPIVESQCAAWLAFCSADPGRKSRRYMALVSDSNGRKILATRYISAVRPPTSLSRGGGLRASVLEACRIVSLIPFLSDPLLFPGISDVWTSIDQLLLLCCGDEEEHAVLLCCWLVSMGLEARLVLGTALPEGDKAAFVYVQHPEITGLLNPTDGNYYSLNDSLCPLISVGTVVTSWNVFGNIQPQSHPSIINWDLTKKTNWKPLWETTRPTPPSIQPEMIAYAELPEDVVIELRSTIEREVRVRFDSNRPYGIPQWNLLAARALREVLQEFDSGRSPNIDEKLSRLRESFVVSSSAIRMPFTSVDETVASVLRLLYHVDASPLVQFAVAVHVEPFFSHIISVSVAIAALTPKNTNL